MICGSGGTEIMCSSCVLIALAGFAVATVAAQQKIERAGINNFTKVDAVVACGGATDTSALEGLKNDGFKAVINLRMANEAGANVEANSARAKELGLTYLHIPFNAQAPDPKLVDSFLAAVADKANQPVFIHCGSANRVGAVWLIKRVVQDGWTIEKATEEARLIGLRSPALEQFAVKYIQERR
jgi:uncharacterized protein (TIGR01244 family)